MTLTIHFLRHGESQANVDRSFANRVDLPAALTTRGREQATDLAGRLAAVPLTHIYSSPLQRARETAEVIATRLGLRTIDVDALREYDTGEFEGLPYDGDAAWRWREYERIDEAWRRGQRHARLPGGESLADIEARFVPFMAQIASIHGADNEIAVVSHGGLYRTMLPLVLDNLPVDHVAMRPLGHYESIVAMLIDERWRCVSWGDQPLPPTTS